MHNEIEILKFNPCKDALDFRKEHSSFQDAWNNCHRGDWMLWIAKRLDIDLRTLTLAKALCAKTVVHLMKDPRSINAVEVAEQFGSGTATREDLNSASDAAYVAAASAAYAAASAASTAYAAAYAAAAADAADAADAAAYAAYAAASATYAAAYAAAAADADAADTAAYAAAAADAADAADAAARKNNRELTAIICREILTKAVFDKLSLNK